MRGIYKITNKLNDRVYIGESLNVERRWDEHLHSLNCNNHHSYKLQNDYNKHGKGIFTFEVIEELENDFPKMLDKYALLVLEHVYINQHDSLKNGYNVEDSFQEVLDKKKRIYRGNDHVLLQQMYDLMKENNWKQMYNTKAENAIVECTLNGKTEILTIVKAIKKFQRFLMITSTNKFGKKPLTPMGLYQVLKNKTEFEHDGEILCINFVL